ncbi:MAG TPA: FAD-dependent oxidoreductase [Chloroflexota bacterium]|nr:FAD-dependent oxidoreductase [Chloroflexota bacterium]
MTDPSVAPAPHPAQRPLASLDGAADFRPQVLVCGGGCAGLVAALAAARNGARTLLVKRAGFAGGIITSVGLPYFDGIADYRQHRVVTPGIPLELFAAMGACRPDATHLPSHNPTIDSVERFKLVADRLLQAEPNLRVLFHTVACDVAMAGDGIRTVYLANKAGLTRVEPAVVVDCTGDADIAARAGAPVETSAELQPMTLHFRIGNVRRRDDTARLCREAVVRAHQRGELPLFYGPGLSFRFAPDEAYVHAVRVPGNGADPHDLTRAEMQGRRDAWVMFEAWCREVPGFEEAYFIASGPCIGVRETRRIVGAYVLTEQDILAGREFPDAIATGCWYLDQHPNAATVGTANQGQKMQPEPYDIPYRTLLPQRVANLLVAGRCHSATQLAASSTRVNATAMALGQAAGTAAALAARGGMGPHEVPDQRLRRVLAEQGAGPVGHPIPGRPLRELDPGRGPEAPASGSALLHPGA